MFQDIRIHGKHDSLNEHIQVVIVKGFVGKKHKRDWKLLCKQFKLDIYVSVVVMFTMEEHL